LPDGTRIGSVNIKHNMAYGVAFILGKLINPKIMVYGKIAYEFGGIKYDYKELSFSNTPNFSKTSNYRKFVPGVGFRYAMADKFHIGFEYGLAPIGKKQVKNDNNSTDGANRRTEAKILDNRFLITLTYRFTTPKGHK
jgi:opacity protein-like surface antigen